MRSTAPLVTALVAGISVRSYPQCYPPFDLIAPVVPGSLH